MDDGDTADGNCHSCTARALALRYDLYKAKLRRAGNADMQN